MRSLYLSVALTVIASCAFAQSNYYDALIEKATTSTLSGDALKAALHDLIDDHQTYPYTSSSADTWDILKESDRDPANPANVILVYSGASVNAAQEYNSGKGWTREHVWAKSRGDFGTSQGAGTDLHHLKPCATRVNSTRNNRNFDNCLNCENVFYNGEATGSYTDGDHYTFTPRRQVRGDIARMIFYMSVRYEGGSEVDLELQNEHLSQSDKSPFHSNLQTLLLWHETDPVDDFERNRNEVIFNYQGNRNPFIDFPNLAELIWVDTTLAWTPDASVVVTEEVVDGGDFSSESTTASEETDALSSFSATFTYETMRVFDSTNNKLILEVSGQTTFSLDMLDAGAYRIEFIGGPFDGTSIHLTRQ